MLDERMILGKTKNGAILSEVEGSRHALSLRRSVTTAAIACVLSLVCLSACTDYVEQMKDDFDDWEAERALESSAALVAASANKVVYYSLQAPILHRLCLPVGWISCTCMSRIMRRTTLTV